MPNTVNLHFKVTKQEVQRIDTETVASGALNTLVANFDFCEVWSGLYKFCRFEGAGGILDVRIENDKCVIPWEVIEAPNFTMACYGTLSTNVILTTKKLSVKVYQSINFIENEPLPPTGTLIEWYENYVANRVPSMIGENVADWLGNHPQYVTNEAHRAYNNVQNMVNDSANLRAGMIIRTLGFHSYGDGGAALYRVSATGSANGMDIISLGSTNNAHLVITDNYVTPEMFGAYGNGISDDTEYFNRISELGVNVCLGNSKTYLLTNSVSFDCNIFNGNGSEILNKSGSSDRSIPYIFTFGNDVIVKNVNFDSCGESRGSIKLNGSNSHVSYCSFTGYSAEHGHEATDSQILIRNANGSNSVVSNCNFVNNGNQYGTALETLNRCITADGEKGNFKCYGCTFDSVNQAIVCSVDDTIISNCYFNGFRDNAIYDFSNNTIINACSFNNSSDEAVITKESTTITNCSFVNIRNRAIGINGTMPTLIIEGCKVYANENFTGTALTFVNSRDDDYVIDFCIFNGNVFKAENLTINYGLNFGSTNNLKFCNNIISGSLLSSGSDNIVRSLNNGKVMVTDNIFDILSSNNCSVNITMNNEATGYYKLKDNFAKNSVRFTGTSFQDKAVGMSVYKADGVNAFSQGKYQPNIITTNVAPDDTSNAPIGTICVNNTNGNLYTKISSGWKKINA